MLMADLVPLIEEERRAEALRLTLVRLAGEHRRAIRSARSRQAAHAGHPGAGTQALIGRMRSSVAAWLHRRGVHLGARATTH